MTGVERREPRTPTEDEAWFEFWCLLARFTQSSVSRHEVHGLASAGHADQKAEQLTLW